MWSVLSTRQHTAITAELSRALAVVKVTFKYIGTANYPGSASRNYWTEKDCDTNDYIEKGKPLETFRKFATKFLHVKTVSNKVVRHSLVYVSTRK